MITFTKEQLIASAHARIEFAEMMLAGELEPLKERTWSIELELARIALASLEAVPVGTFKKGPCGYHPSFHEDAVPLYTAPPAPVYVPAAMEMDDDFDSAFEHGKAVGWNAYRAAMLQSFGNSEQLNSPVIPDGWKLVPIDPTKDMLRAGQSVVGFWLNTVHCYSKMLAAAPAAPQQEAENRIQIGKSEAKEEWDMGARLTKHRFKP